MKGPMHFFLTGGYGGFLMLGYFFPDITVF